ncbi:MAG: SUMF1/EgtB/PvdO family nonheme iron enzyme [Planctomycetes bacterium]|nr:SUMF1/EgtB/PvdO family nonheme iron enzyme [Planctomycetota bacterium]
MRPAIALGIAPFRRGPCAELGLRTQRAGRARPDRRDAWRLAAKPRARFRAEAPRRTSRGPVESGRDRVLRGGSYRNEARRCRSANRNRNAPDNARDNYGFRLVLSAPEPAGGTRAAGLQPLSHRPRADRAPGSGA